MNTDQLAAEAAKRCLDLVRGDDPWPVEAYGKCEQIIKSAIEKAHSDDTNRLDHLIWYFQEFFGEKWSRETIDISMQERKGMKNQPK